MKNIKDNIVDLLPLFPIVVEVGAHYGEDTIELYRILSPTHIYCFEPDPRNIEIFKKYIPRNSRISLFELAVSNEDAEQVNFYLGYSPKVSDNTLKKYYWISKTDYLGKKLNASGASSLRKGHSLVGGNRIVHVNTTRLDSWARKEGVDHIDFLWIDVQGAERNVIEGLGDLLSSVLVVWIEFGELDYEGAMSRNETIELFSKKGFELDTKYSDSTSKGNLLFRRGKWYLQ